MRPDFKLAQPHKTQGFHSFDWVKYGRVNGFTSSGLIGKKMIDRSICLWPCGNGTFPGNHHAVESPASMGHAVV